LIDRLNGTLGLFFSSWQKIKRLIWTLLMRYLGKQTNNNTLLQIFAKSEIEHHQNYQTNWFNQAQRHTG